MIRLLLNILVALLAYASPAHADPISAAIVAWVGITGTAATIATFVLTTAFTIGVNALASKLLMPKSKSAAQDRQASVLQLSIGEGPREAVFGRAATGGTLLDAYNFGGDNGTDWEVRVVKVADHKCDAFEGFYVDDTFYAYTADGAQPDFSGQLEVYWLDGSAGQAASSYLVSSSASRLYGVPWTTADVASSMAVVIYAYKADPPNATTPVWPQGRPTFKALVRGKRCYDPRKDSTVPGGSGAHRWDTPSTWEWSENARICDYNYDRGIFANDDVTHPEHLLIGRGLTALQAKPERVFAAANVCDEDVALKAGGTEKRYMVGGVIFSDVAFIDVKEMFAAAMAGVILKRDGGVEIEPGASKAVVAELTDADLVIGESATLEGFLSDPDRINTVVPRYVAPDQLWADHAAPVRRSTADILADGGLKSDDLSLAIVTSGTQAQRCGEILRRQNRKERRGALVLSPKWSCLEDGDWIGFTSDRRFKGGRVVFRLDATGVQQDYRTPVVLREMGADCYAWDPATDEGVPGQAPIDEAGSLAPLELAGVTIVAYAINADDGSIQPAVKATWTTPVDPAIRGVRLEVRLVGAAQASGSVTNDPNSGVMVMTDGVASASDMEARVVPLTMDGRRVTPSAWIALATDAFELASIIAAFNDGDLTPGEKLYVVPELKAHIAQRSGLRSRADDLNLLTTNNLQRLAYENAATALDTQLAALNATGPVDWDDSSDLTKVDDPASLRTALTNAFVGAVDLQDVINETFATKVSDIDARQTELAGDGVLTPGEKFQLVPQINKLIFARANLRAQANAMGLTTGSNAQRIAFENAATALDAYLATLNTPVPWNNTSGDTTIAAPATFQTNFSNALNSEINLQTVIDGQPTGGAFGSNLTESPGGATATLNNFKTGLGIAGGITGQGLWATAAVPSGLTPTILGQKTTYLASDGKTYNYQTFLYGQSIDGTAGRVGQPLSSSSSTVAVSGSTVTFPNGIGATTTISVPGAFFSGLSASTTYSVFWNPANGVWACQPPSITPAYYSSPDNWLFIGAIRTQDASGGYTDPGYGAGVPPYCVADGALIGSGLRAGDADVGDPLLMMARAGDDTFPGGVRAIGRRQAQCLTIRTAAGGALTVSYTAPVMIRDGERQMPRAIQAAALEVGMMVPLAMRGWTAGQKPRWDVVVAVDDAGVIGVTRISAGNGIFAATDETAAPPIFTHNSYNKP